MTNLCIILKQPMILNVYQESMQIIKFVLWIIRNDGQLVLQPSNEGFAGSEPK